MRFSSVLSSHPSRRTILTGAAALGGMSLLPRRARADQWPTRPVKLVVPFAAGGTTDILARVVAAKVSEEFGQQFIVENKTGAGGNIAAEFVAKAEPDGYTFVVGTPADDAHRRSDLHRCRRPGCAASRTTDLDDGPDQLAGALVRRTPDRLCLG